MTEEAGDDDLSDMGSMGTPASTQPHHQNSSSVCVCVFFLCGCLRRESNVSVGTWLCNNRNYTTVAGQIEICIGNWNMIGSPPCHYCLSQLQHTLCHIAGTWI